MVQLNDIQRQTEELYQEDRESLAAYLLHGFTGMPLGLDDAEVDRREAELDSGPVTSISHAQFPSQVGRAK